MRYNKTDKCFKNNWLCFYPKFDSFSFICGPASYFDNRWYIHCFLTQPISLLLFVLGLIFGLGAYSMLFFVLFFVPWGDLYVHLPIKSNWDECSPPRYGINIHDDSIWFHWGDCEKRQHQKRYYVFHFPWSLVWVRTSNLKKDGTWEHETKGNYKNFYEDKWKEIVWNEDYPYTYVLKSGKIQERIATIKVEEREWRRRWLKWSSLFSKSSKTISIDFSYGGKVSRETLFEKKLNKKINEDETGEVGERTGSWKGGTVGCGYDMLPGETPLETLRRMERERIFN